MKLSNILIKGERWFLAILFLGLALNLIQLDSKLTISVGLIGLGVVYFLSAFKVPPMATQEGQLQGFKELFTLTILPKILWIGTSVTFVGILFYLAGSNIQGYRQMLGSGSFTIAVCLIIIIAMSGTKSISSIIPVLYRAIPAMGVGFYLLYQ